MEAEIVLFGDADWFKKNIKGSVLRYELITAQWLMDTADEQGLMGDHDDGDEEDEDHDEEEVEEEEEVE